MMVETGSRADSVGAMRAECFGLTTTAAVGAGAAGTAMGATVDEAVGADAAAPVPRAVRALPVDAAGAPQAATPTTARTVPTPTTALVRVHGMNPLSLPKEHYRACSGQPAEARTRQTGG